MERRYIAHLSRSILQILNTFSHKKQFITGLFFQKYKTHTQKDNIGLSFCLFGFSFNYLLAKIMYLSIT